MTQTVNDIADLMSDNTSRPKSNLQIPSMLRYFFTVLVLGLLVLILVMGGKALRDAPPASHSAHMQHYVERVLRERRGGLRIQPGEQSQGHQS